MKTSDYRADRKWSEYLEFCDAFYFAVPVDFPLALLPPDSGMMVADDYGAEILRRVAPQPMNGSRRRAQTLRLAVAAMQRLGRMVDPEAGA
ncbi:MAG: MmcB family DNA repair protein [Dongiaceae bacterium]